MRIRMELHAVAALTYIALAGCDGGAAEPAQGQDAAGDVGTPGAPDTAASDDAQGASTGQHDALPDSATADGGPGDAPLADGGDASGGGDVSGGSDTSPDVVAPSGPPFYGVVQPILQEHCQLCHVDGGLGPFPLVTWENVAPLAPLVAAAVSERHMPPWGQQDTDACDTLHPFKDDISLSDAQIATIVAWAEGGTAEGDPSLALPPRQPISNALPNPTHELVTPPTTVSAGKDLFRCYVLDPGFDADTWINGVHFVPSNDEVAHHALLFLDAQGTSTAMADDTGAFDCFGGAPGDQLIAAWAPGGRPMELPGGAGVPVQAGSKLVLQMHYHPSGLDDETDATTIQLRALDAEPALFAFTALIGNFGGPQQGGDGLLPGPADGGSPKFLIPAGATSHTESMAFTVPATLDGAPMPRFSIHAVASHMHYVGKDMIIELDRATGGACTSDELAPLLGCLADNCAGVALGDLQSCAVASCAGSVEGLSAGCTDCLVANVAAGSPELIAAACQTPVTTDQPAQECLLQTPRWDFHWQRFYVVDVPLEALPTVGAGDRLRFRCTYDNSLDNHHVADALASQGLDAPVDVRLGEETLDEMCLVALQLVYTPTD